MEGPQQKRGRKAILPQLPTPLEQEVQRIAEEIVVERTAEARRTAALEVANKLLKTVADLFKHAATGVVLTQGTAAPVPPRPTIINPCVLCGRQGVWQDRSGKGGQPWYCKAHAQGAIMDQRTEVAGAGLLQSLKQAAPIDDTALPE